MITHPHTCTAHRFQRVVSQENPRAAASIEVIGCRCTTARVYPHPIFGFLAEHDEHAHGARWGRTEMSALRRAQNLCRAIPIGALR